MPVRVLLISIYVLSPVKIHLYVYVCMFMCVCLCMNGSAKMHADLNGTISDSSALLRYITCCEDAFLTIFIERMLT